MEAAQLPVMIAVALTCLPIFFTGYMIARWEGALLLGVYAAYTFYLILAAKQHDSLEPFSAVLFYFVLPLIAITLGAASWNEWRGRRYGRSDA